MSLRLFVPKSLRVATQRVKDSSTENLMQRRLPLLASKIETLRVRASVSHIQFQRAIMADGNHDVATPVGPVQWVWCGCAGGCLDHATGRGHTLTSSHTT